MTNTQSAQSTLQRAIPLGELCQVDRHVISPSAPEFPDLPYVGLEHIEAQTGRILQPLGGGIKSTGFRFDNRHVLYGRLRPYLNKIAIPDFSGRCSSEIIPLLPRKGESRNLLACALRQPAVVDFAVHNSTGSRMPRINIERLLEFPVYVPDTVAERKRLGNAIPANLCRAAKMKMAMQVQAEIITALPHSILAQIFGQEKIPKGWESIPLGELCEISTGKTPTRADRAAFTGNNPWVKIGDMDGAEKIIRSKEMLTDKAIKEYKCRPVAPGTLLLSYKLSIGKVAFAGIPLYTNEAIAALQILDSAQITPEYLYWALRGMPLDKGAGTAAKGKTLNQQKLKKIEIPIPPLAEQRIIAQMLKTKMKIVAKLQSAAQVQLNAAEALPAALLHRAFSSR